MFPLFLESYIFSVMLLDFVEKIFAVLLHIRIPHWVNICHSSLCRDEFFPEEKLLKIVIYIYTFLRFPGEIIRRGKLASWKLFVGENFRHQSKVLPLCPDDFSHIMYYHFVCASSVFSSVKAAHKLKQSSN